MNRPLTQLLFYTTPGCHLCEQAAAILSYAQQSREFAVESVDIATDEALVSRYGIRIPVVAMPTAARELDWPFTYEELLAFIEES